MTVEPVITADGLCKRYRVTEKAPGLMGAVRGLVRPRRCVVQAVEDVSFDISRGEVVGYLGPNGAGKSTTIKMLCGILRPTRGQVTIEGLDPHRHRRQVVQRIGVVFGQRSQLFWDLRLGESFGLLQRIYAIPDEAYREQLTWLGRELGLDALMDRPVRVLSLGQRMRAEMAAALIHRPAVVFLDEPTIGLDLEAKQAVRGFIRRAAEDLQTTVILTTHDLEDVEALCRRLIVIDHGRVVEDGPLDELSRRLAPWREISAQCELLPEELSFSQAEIIERGAEHLRLRFRREETTAAAVIAELTAQVRVRDLSLQEPAIEDVIRLLYGTGVVTAET